ncbi:ribonuclease P protein component [Clostridiales bacterium KA00134]|nr:ribonuclease P protein component [Clostridiales bacterium KA00134]
MDKDIYLKKSRDFDSVYGKRNIFGNRNLTFYMKKNRMGHPRLGFSISKKVGNAVTRNLLKRRLKSIYRQYKDILNLGVDGVIVVKKSCVDISYKELEGSFVHVIRGGLKKFKR